MAATGYGQTGDLSRVAKAGDTMTGTLVLDGTAPLEIPEGAGDGDIWTSDALGNGSWKPAGASTGALQIVNNLSDVASAGTSRTNLGLGTAAQQNVSAFLQPTNNLSDLTSAGAARASLGLGTAAVASLSSLLQVGNNLSDVASAATARLNLGLGSAATAATSAFLLPANNLSDLTSAASARVNLGLGSAATLASSAFLQSGNNLSDVSSAGIARTNLGLGSAALLSTAAVAQTVNNLSDLASAGSARSNLGLGTAATQNLAAFLQPANNLSDLSSAGAARTSLGLGSASLQSSASFLQSSSNLSDVSSTGTARSNLGLGTAATENVNTTNGTIAALGVQAAGASGQLADAAHVHVMPRLDQVSAPSSAVSLNSNKIVLLSNGSVSTDAAAFGQIPLLGSSATSQTSYGLTASSGSNTAVSHSDHTHGTPSLTVTAPAATLAIGTSASLGSAVLPALADHVHPMSAAASPTNSAVTDSASTGAATTFAASNHVHGREGFGVVTAQTAFGLASANGSAATVSRSDHAHGTPPSYNYDLPSQHGWLDWNMPSKMAATGKVLATSGAVYLMAFRPQVSGIITNIVVQIPTIGSGLTANESFAGLYSQNGTNATLMSSTADQTASWGSTGLKTMALLAAQSVTAGTTYLVGLLSSWATTGPSFCGTAGSNNGVINGGQTAATPFEFGVFSSGMTVLPGSITMSSISGTNAALPIFVASS